MLLELVTLWHPCNFILLEICMYLFKLILFIFSYFYFIHKFLIDLDQDSCAIIIIIIMVKTQASRVYGQNFIGDSLPETFINIIIHGLIRSLAKKIK